MANACFRDWIRLANGKVHRARAHDVQLQTRLLTGSACNAWLSAILDSECTVNYGEQETQLLGGGHREAYRI
jgi:hypothetical protein